MLTPQPAEPLPPILPIPDPPPTITQHRPRVLLIEDDPIQGRSLQRLLDHHGISAHNVASAAAGLQAIATQPPYHAVISDLLLPDLPGDELARRLRGPLLLAYTGLDRFAPWFDATLRKPELCRLLHMLQAPRMMVMVTSDEPGVHEGHCPELGLRCRGSSPAEVLRLLARILEERLQAGT